MARSGCPLRNGRSQTSVSMPGSSDDVFEAVGGVTRQPHALAAAAEVLAVRPLHVDVPLLLLTAAARLRAALRREGTRPLGTGGSEQSES